MPEIRTARAEDVPVLAPRLRAADKRELKAATGKGPKTALRDSFEVSSKVHSIVEGNDVLGMFGVTPHPEDFLTGLCWGVSAPELMTGKHKLWFIRNSPRILEIQHRHFPELWGLIDARNTRHLRWLEWTGFQLGATYCVGPERRPFVEFRRTQGQANV